MWLSSFSNTFYWSDNPFPIVYSWCLCQRLVDFICMGLLLDSLLCSIYLSVYFNASTILFWLLHLHNILWNQVVWNLHLFSSFSRLLWLFEVFCGFIQISGFFSCVCEKCHWHFDRNCINVNHVGKYGHFDNIKFGHMTSVIDLWKLLNKTWLLCSPRFSN